MSGRTDGAELAGQADVAEPFGRGSGACIAAEMIGVAVAIVKRNAAPSAGRNEATPPLLPETAGGGDEELASSRREDAAAEPPELVAAAPPPGCPEIDSLTSIVQLRPGAAGSTNGTVTMLPRLAADATAATFAANAKRQTASEPTLQFAAGGNESSAAKMRSQDVESPSQTPHSSTRPDEQQAPDWSSAASQQRPEKSTAVALPPQTPHASSALVAPQQAPSASSLSMPVGQQVPEASRSPEAQQAPVRLTTPEGQEGGTSQNWPRYELRHKQPVRQRETRG